MRIESKKCEDCRDIYICEKPFDDRKDCQDQILAANVYTDRLRVVGDSIEILHNFAIKIEIPHNCFIHGDYPMYYLPNWRLLKMAIQAGAIIVPDYMTCIIGMFTKGVPIYERETGKVIVKGKEG